MRTRAASQVLLLVTALTGAVLGWWRPKNQEDTWQWQLLSVVDLSYDVSVYEIDLFDIPAADITTLQGRNIKVICYISGGSYEEWRTDAGDFEESVLGNPLEDWPGERWLNITAPSLRPIMEARLDLAVTKNCDAVEVDNMDVFNNNNGFGITPGDQLTYSTWFAEQAHLRDLSVALKNNPTQVDELEALYDFSVTEQAYENDEMDAYKPFVEAGKAVFDAEYLESDLDPQVACPALQRSGFTAIFKELSLEAEPYISCDNLPELPFTLWGLSVSQLALAGLGTLAAALVIVAVVRLRSAQAAFSKASAEETPLQDAMGRDLDTQGANKDGSIAVVVPATSTLRRSTAGSRGSQSSRGSRKEGELAAAFSGDATGTVAVNPMLYSSTKSASPMKQRTSKSSKTSKKSKNSKRGSKRVARRGGSKGSKGSRGSKGSKRSKQLTSS